MKKIAILILLLAIGSSWYMKQKPSATDEPIDQLVLVNQKNPLNHVPTDLINLFEQQRSYDVFTSDITLSSRVAEALEQMIQDARAQGLSHFIVMSGYRSFEQQQALYEEMGAAYAMKPGYSEHHTGLALDIGSTETTMDVAPEGKWIADNAWRYGFILRYPADKVAITGIEYEPWHLRFVGLPHSQQMFEQNLALEEYVAK